MPWVKILPTPSGDNHNSPYALELLIRDLQKIVVDEPEKRGGCNLGPSPAELFIAAAGSCLGMAFLHAAKKYGCAPTDFQIYVSGHVALREQLILEGADPECDPWNLESGMRKVSILIRPRFNGGTLLPSGMNEIEFIEMLNQQYRRYSIISNSIMRGIELETFVRTPDGRDLPSPIFFGCAEDPPDWELEP